MKTFLITFFLLLSNTAIAAGMPCQHRENYGTVKWISPVPYWNSVRFQLTGGRTAASTNGVFSIPVPITDPLRLELFRQTVDILRDAQASNRIVYVETTNCSAPTGMAVVSFIQTGLFTP